MKRRKNTQCHVLAGVAFASAIMSPSAIADVFTNSVAFSGANAGLTLFDFEGVAADNTFALDVASYYATQGLQFSHPTSSNTSIGILGANGFLGNTSSMLSTSVTNAPILIEFANQVTSVGFNVSTLDFVQFPALSAGVTIEVFNGSTLLATETFNTATPDLMTSFIGFSNLGSDITSVLVTGNTANPNFGASQQYIDNLMISVVPIPNAAYAGLAMLGSMGAYRRIRK